MKHTPKIIVTLGLVVSLVLSLVLAGCGASSSSPSSASSSTASSSMDMMAPAAADAAPKLAPQMRNSLGATGEAAAMDSKTNTTAAVPPDDQPRKLVKNSNLSLETTEFDTALTALVKMVEELGGYVDQQSVDGVSLRSHNEYYERSAQLQARIPADKLDSFTSQAGELCNVVAHSEGIRDITDSYYDAQSRLDVLTVKEARLLELLAKAEKLEDIITLEDALTTCQYEMDSLTGQLRRMDNLVSYSTCNISLNEVVEYSDVQTTPRTFGERLGDAIRYSWRNLTTSVQYTIINLVESGPVVIFYLLVWGGILYLVYRVAFRKRLAARKAAKHIATDKPDTTAHEEAPASSDE